MYDDDAWFDPNAQHTFLTLFTPAYALRYKYTGKCCSFSLVDCCRNYLAHVKPDFSCKVIVVRFGRFFKCKMTHNFHTNI